MWGGGGPQTILALALFILLLLFYSTPLSMVVMDREKEEEMALCPCKRVLPRVSLEEVALNATTCGEDAWRRGRHQRVLAFTFFEPTDGPVAEEKENRQYLQVSTKHLRLLLKSVGQQQYSIEHNNLGVFCDI